MGRQSSYCDHDLTDYEAYIDHMVELRDGQLRKINQIPASEMTQAVSKEVASSPELFHMDRTTCELDKRPLFRLWILHFTKEFPVSWVTMVVGKSTLFRSILQFQKYKGRITWKGTVLKKKKGLVS